MIGQVSARCRFATSFEPVFEPDSVMEFGFYKVCTKKNAAAIRKRSLMSEN